jgi:hypothetical protein
VNLLIRPFRPSCCKGCLVPFRGGDTSPSKFASFRGDCWLRKRNSSMRSLVLFEYAIFMSYNTTDSQLLLLFQVTRAEEKALMWGLQHGDLRNCSRPGLSASPEREYLQISKKERMRASWRPRRAKQMLYPGRRLRSRNLDSGRE